MKHIKLYNESNSDLNNELREILKGLPEDMRWNIIEDEGYFGDEWDSFEHMDEEERYEYFKKIYSTLKKIKDLVG